MTSEERLKFLEDYKITRIGSLERIESIPEDVNIIEYLKSEFFNKNGEYYYEDDDNILTKIDVKFEGSDILVYPNGEKYKLIVKQDVIEPIVLDIYFDIRYPNDINHLLKRIPEELSLPFGYKQWLTNNKGNKWLDGNDCFIPMIKID